MEQFQIEHVGSSSISNLRGKGVINIAIDAKEEKDQLVKVLQALGYELRLDHSTDLRIFLKMKRPRTYHIHVLSFQSNEWQDLQRYAELKEKASLEASGQGFEYRKLKEPFFKEILQKNLDIKIFVILYFSFYFL